MPPKLRGAVALPGYDYLDAFTLPFAGADAWTAENWARCMFQDDRPLVVRALTRGLLGVVLQRPDPSGRIGGYTIVASEPRLVRASVSSQLSDDQVVVMIDAGSISLITAVRHRVSFSRAVWAMLGPLHRSFAPRVLRHAASRARVAR